MYEQNFPKEKNEQEKYIEKMNELIEKLEGKAEEKFGEEGSFWI